MRITEPTTMATDYALAMLALVFALGTWHTARQSRQKSVGFWALALAAMGLAAAVGGTWHGFVLHLHQEVIAALWKATMYLTGLMSFAMLSAAILASLPASVHRLMLGIAALKLALYTLWMSSHDEFRYVIYDYGLAMLAVLFLQAWVAYRWCRRSAAWIIAGVLVSFAGAAVQQSGLKLHEHFNHNDLYHLVQMGATWLFYRGGRLLRDR